MNILIACHEKTKSKNANIFSNIEKYWKKAGFHVAYDIRNDENAIRTPVEIERDGQDYIIIIDGIGCDAATTQGGLSYNNYSTVILFLFLDGKMFEKYQNIEMGLNCYVIVSQPQFDICNKLSNIHSTVCIPRQLECYDWSCFSAIRSDAVENERLIKKEFDQNTKKLDILLKEYKKFEKTEAKMNQLLLDYMDNKADDLLKEIKNESESIDPYLKMILKKRCFALDNLLEIWGLENKTGYENLFLGANHWDELIGLYDVLVSVMNRFLLPSASEEQEEGLQWLVQNRISPIAIMIFLEKEYNCKDVQIYLYFAGMYQILGDEKGEQLIKAYAEKYSK